MPTSHFIPASRAFFSLFYENLFSILSSASNLDPFLMEFGNLYESFRSMYNRHLDTIQDSFPLEFSKQILNGDIILKQKVDTNMSENIVYNNVISTSQNYTKSNNYTNSFSNCSELMVINL